MYRITNSKNEVSETFRSLEELRADPQIVLIEKYMPGSGTWQSVDRHDGSSWQNESRQTLLS